jgi:tRNA threonylcarbamoyladenosine biosynthesis protein TsaE
MKRQRLEPAAHGPRLVLRSEAETRALAGALAQRLAAQLRADPQRSIVLGLIGDLGAGKTAFVRGFVAGLDPAREAEVSSPTYALIHQYPGQPEVRHVDLYRLESAADIAGIGLYELWSEPGLTLVEWADKLSRAIPGPHIDIRLAEGPRNVREIQLETTDPALRSILDDLAR